MTCRHSAGDPNCSSNQSRSYDRDVPATPNAEDFQITKVEQVERNLVLEVRYPNCSKCAYEGRKVMVFLKKTAKDALMWCRIDPHFRKPATSSTEAPGPDARFPASEEGWKHALAFAEQS